MLYRSVILLLLAAIPLSACQVAQHQASQLSLTNAQTQITRVNPKTGEPYIVSKSRQSTVAVALSNDPAWQDFGTAVVVKLSNNSKTPIAMGGGRIVAFQNSRDVKVLDYSGMQAAIQEKQQQEEALATVGIFASALAGGLAGSGRFNAPTSALLSAGSTMGLSMSTAALTQASASARDDLDEAPLSFIADTILGPGQQMSGLVVLRDIDRSGPIKISVLGGADDHAFVLQP